MATTKINMNQIQYKKNVSSTDTDVTLDVEANTFYSYTNPLTSLSITTVANSTLETLIKFTVGSGFTLTIAQGIAYIGTLPTTWTQGEQYVISILLGVITIAKVNTVA